MTGRLSRIPALMALTIATATAIAGCSIGGAAEGRPEQTIPAALLALDLGITDAEADTTTSGLSVGVTAWVTVDRDTMTADDLRQILEVVVENTAVSNIRTIKVGATDGTSDDRASIDLTAAGEELGFAPSTDGPGSFTAEWKDVVGYLEKDGS